MSDNLNERKEMVNDFVTESRDLLDEIEPQIIAMEEYASDSGVVDDEILNSIFRLFHSIKGMASFLDLQTVINVTHEAETLLDIFRKGKGSVNPEHIELLYRTGDFIKGLLDNIEQQLTDGGMEDVAEEIIGTIQQTIRSIDGESPQTDKSEQESEEVPEEVEVFNFVITPEMTKRFVDEGQEIIEEAETILLQLEDQPQNSQLVEQVFRAFHSFKGNAGFLGYGGMEKVSHRAESILAEIRDGQGVISSEVVSALLRVVDWLRDSLRQVLQGEGTIPENENILQVLDNLLTTEESPTETVQQNGSQEIEENAEQVPDSKKVVALKKETEESKQRAEKKTVGNGQQAIRVDVEKLDSLLDLVGELVISTAMVSNNPDLQGLQLDRFEKAVRQLNKITRDIQDVSMSMRMIPLAGIFRKMVRLVRDVSMKTNKDVGLTIIGEETEVDKSIIEQISDPLVHLIRNAVDHGIETKEQRRAAGKPEKGQVTIEARQTAGEVWIMIKDDGKGLHRDKILIKAREKGLISDEHRELKDEEVWKLIFEPGFSTAEEVSSISGRGVGMDVVKSNIEKLRGRIEIRTTPGQGTLFIIRIPLTLAIIEGMVVRVGKSLYTIPITSIRESFQPRPGQITVTPDGTEIVRIRGDLLPVIRLHRLYNVKSINNRLTDGILIVVESEAQKCCMFVDELVGQQQIVIKALPAYLGNVRGLSGMAILGDGEVSMILDIENLISSVKGLLEIKERNFNSWEVQEWA